jgi:polysaccharide deacetylase 2 family uncharacterized protein YibQ
VIVLNLLAGACSRTTPKQVKEKELDPRELAGRVQQAIERAGGTEIWVKSGAPSDVRSNSPYRNSARVEVLAVSPKYDAVVDAIKEEARAEGLKAETQQKNSKKRSRSTEFRLVWRKEFIGQWHVREVPRLLRAAIVIDDLGQDLDAARKLIRQPYPLTFSVLPDLAHSIETAREAHAAGRAIMLHLPMEPEPAAGVYPGPGEITVGMRGDAVAQMIREDLSSVPFAGGVNNHMGSRATTDAKLMAEVMRVLAARGLYFVDSRTTAETNALVEARRLGLPSFYRSVFLDDTETVAYTLEQLRNFRRTVQEHGVALAIGHPHQTTIAALAQFLPEFAQADIQLMPASQLVRLPEIVHLQPPNRGPNVAQEKSTSHY